MKASVLKPGLLVSLKTSIRGGVDYQRVDLEADHDTGDGGRRARWETKREIADAAEYEKATKIRGQARSLITATCCASSFGLLCPYDKESALERALADARDLVDDFNRTAARSRVEVYVITGRIAQNDAEAARAISAEVRELLSEMQAGIAACSPEAIREAANKARALGEMLSPDVSAKVQDAIGEARRAAREIVKRVEKAGESAVDVVKDLSVRRIESARFAFLDLDEQQAPVQSDAPAARGIDLEPEEQQPAPADPFIPQSASQLGFELEI